MFLAMKVVYPDPVHRVEHAPGCAGKIAYPTHADAVRGMLGIRRRPTAMKQHDEFRANAYFCGHCHAYHWGNRPRKLDK